MTYHLMNDVAQIISYKVHLLVEFFKFIILYVIFRSDVLNVGNYTHTHTYIHTF